MALSLSGLATGLDTSSMIQQILASEQKPLQLLQTRQLKAKALDTSFTDLNAKLAALAARAKTPTSREGFFSRSVSSSADTVATASASAGALRGTFSLTVTSLARGSIAAAGSTVATLETTVASAPGTLTFKLGASGTPVSIAVSASTTLGDLVKAVNDANAGVKAAAVNVGTSAAPAYKLSLTSVGTGTANDIQIVGDGTTLGLASTQAATDAAFAIAGLGSFTRSTNSFSDVLDGVTITLKANSGSTDLAVDYDRTSTQARVQSLLDAYNDVVRTIDGQTAVKKNSDGSVTPGAFTGDVTTRQIRLRLAGVSGTVVGAGRTSALATIGITTASDGTLALDATKFQSALGADADGVRALITGTSTASGVAGRLFDVADGATRAVTGSIAARKTGLSDTIRALQKQIDSTQSRLAVEERQLRQRFAHLEEMVSKLQSTGSSLLSSLTKLGTGA